MLTAERADGERIVAGTATKGEAAYCPECRSALVLKRGRIVTAHFAHAAKSACGLSVESIRHHQMKQQVCSLFPDSEVEASVHGRRADVIVGARYVVECQESAISIAEMEARTADYNRLGYSVLWVWDFRRVTSTGAQLADGIAEFLSEPALDTVRQIEFRIPAEIRHIHRLCYGRIYVMGKDGELWSCHLERGDLRISDWAEDTGHYPKTLKRLRFNKRGGRFRVLASANGLRFATFDEPVYWQTRAQRTEAENRHYAQALERTGGII